MRSAGCIRGTFYNHIFRRVDRSKYEEEKAQLMLKIKQIFDDSEQRYGANKIRTVLVKNGMHVSTKRVSAIMRELGLYSIRTDAKKLYKTQQQRKKQNLLNREFNADHPNQIWVSDITYFRIQMILDVPLLQSLTCFLVEWLGIVYPHRQYTACDNNFSGRLCRTRKS